MRGLLLALVLLPLAGEAKGPGRLVLLATGDNAGEIAPCGCKHNPTGGLARRKTAIAAERAKGAPVLVVDAGNALFQTEAGDAPRARERAALLVRQMGALGTAAMAVGARDLALGLDFLRTSAAKAALPLVSANLVDAKGQRLFSASRVVELGGLKIGLVGLSPEGKRVGQAPGIQGLPLVPAALSEAQRLKVEDQVDVVVVLAAAPYPKALELAREAPRAIDFVVQSHEGRGAGMALRHAFATLVPPGALGRQMAKLDLRVSGPGVFADAGEAERTRAAVRVLDANLATVKQRLASRPDAATRKSLEDTLGSFTARKRSLEGSLARPESGPARSFTLSYVTLGEGFAGDPAIQAEVAAVEAPLAAP